MAAAGAIEASGQPSVWTGRMGTPSASFGRAQEKTPHRGVGAEADGALACRPRGRDVTLDAGEVRERGASWVEPRLVAQIGFSEWTRDGRLRHPRFLGLRDDKAAEEVVREG